MPMIETLIQSVGPAALAVGVMWRWLRETRERATYWRDKYESLTDRIQTEAAKDREAYEEILKDQARP